MNQTTVQFQDKDRVRAIDSVYRTLTNGWGLTVHWKSRVYDLVNVPDGDTEESYLSWWEDEKPKHNENFVSFVEAFGLAALLASVNVGQIFKCNIWFNDRSSTVEGNCYIKEVDVDHAQKLIEVFVGC